MKSIEERIYDIVESISGVSDRPYAPLEELGLDSLDCFDLECRIENEFDISIPNDSTNPHRIKNYMSAHDVVLMVEYQYLGVRKEDDL